MFFRRKKTNNRLMEKVLKYEVPKHIAIILDGNGRWAQNRSMPRKYGHKVGGDNLLNIMKFSQKIGIKNLTVYAFSTENWKRPKEEVDYLMNAPIKFFDKHIPIFKELKIKVKFIGDLEKIPTALKEKCDEITKITKDYNDFVLAIALNYGSKDEIVTAVKKVISSANTENLLQEITEESIEKNLYTSDMYPLDLLIRPGGELRLSNYLLWQVAYSELYFSNVLWPDFNNNELLLAIHDYQRRNRRFGGLNKGDKQ